MSEDGGADSLVRRPGAKSLKTSQRKWGADVINHGWCIVPSLLLRGQKRLRLGPAELAVLLQLLDHWWEAERLPFPSKEALADRLGVSERTVQRHVQALEAAGYVRRIARHNAARGQQSNHYSFDGLVAALKRIEPDFHRAREDERHRRDERKERQRQAAAPGLKNRSLVTGAAPGTSA
jgi:DNA-binding transcriptional ArsR family regulator